MSESSVSLDFTRQLMAKGIVGSAADWLQKALHPAGSSPVAVCIPDHSRVPSVCMDFRPTVVVGPPFGLASDDLWDCLVWCPPGDGTAAVVVTGVANTNFNTARPENVTVSVLSTQSGTTIGEFATAPVYRSDPALPGGFTSGSFVANSLPMEFRTSYRSITASLTASSLNNQGTVYSTQFARRFTPDGALTADPGGSVQYIVAQSVTSVPFDENTLNLLSPSAETRPAKEGVYMPLRLAGPSQPFITRTSFYDKSMSLLARITGDPETYGFGLYDPLSVRLNTADGTPEFSYPFLPLLPMTTIDSGRENDDVAPFYPPWQGGPVPGTPYGVSGYMTKFIGDNGAGCWDLGYDNCSQGIIIFRGLSQQATITLQAYVGLEMIPCQDSPVRSFVRSPGVPDLRALQVYYEIANSMAVSYPARYNSMGLLLPFLVEAARTVLPHIPTIVSYVRDVVQRVRQRQVTAPPQAPAQAKTATTSAPRKLRKKKR
jgi:hypothetical protein